MKLIETSTELKFSSKFRTNHESSEDDSSEESEKVDDSELDVSIFKSPNEKLEKNIINKPDRTRYNQVHRRINCWNDRNHHIGTHVYNSFSASFSFVWLHECELRWLERKNYVNKIN